MQQAILQIEQRTISFIFRNENQTEYKARQSMDLPFQAIAAQKFIPFPHLVFHKKFILEFTNWIVL